MSTFGNSINKNSTTVPSPPEDTVSHMSFSQNMPSSVYLAASSWDGSISCWEVNSNRTVVPKARQTDSQPLFHTCWSGDGKQIFTACGDGTAKVWDLQSNQYYTIAQHDKPVRTVHYIISPNSAFLMTSGWDCNIKFWDCRCPNPMKVLTSDTKFCAGDMIYPMAFFLRTDNKVQLCSLSPEPQFHRLETLNDLKYTGRCVAGFVNASKTPDGFAVGGSDGRVHVTYLNNSTDNYVFKCHRQGVTNSFGQMNSQNVHMVNAMAFHPTNRTLMTAGGDGFYYGWNIRSKAKICSSVDYGKPLTACCFSSDGNVMAVALGYDWAKGYKFSNPGTCPPEIHVKQTGNEFHSSTSYGWR